MQDAKVSSSKDLSVKKYKDISAHIKLNNMKNDNEILLLNKSEDSTSLTQNAINKYENAFSSINLNEELDLVSPKFKLPELKNEHLMEDVHSMKWNKGFRNFLYKYEDNLMNTLQKLDDEHYVKFKHLLVDHLKQNNIYRKYKYILKKKPQVNIVI